MQRKFIINPQQTKVYPLCPISVSDKEYTDYYKPGEYKKVVDDWLEENMDEPFLVDIKYNNKWFWSRQSFTLREYDTRGAIFNEDNKVYKVEIINDTEITNEKP